MRSFVFRRKDKVWVWIAMNRETREIVASACGDHSENTCWILWDKDAIALWQRYHAGGVDDYTREAQNITQAIDRHLKPRSLDDPDNQRLLDQIGWHHAALIRWDELADLLVAMT